MFCIIYLLSFISKVSKKHICRDYTCFYMYVYTYARDRIQASSVWSNLVQPLVCKNQIQDSASARCRCSSWEVKSITEQLKHLLNCVCSSQKLEGALLPTIISISQLARQWEHRPSYSDNRLSYCTSWITVHHAGNHWSNNSISTFKNYSNTTYLPKLLRVLFLIYFRIEIVSFLMQHTVWKPNKEDNNICWR